MSGERAWMIYGAYGYTGELAAREAARRGLAPILAGRRGEATEAIARELGLEHRVFGLDDPGQLAAGLDGVAAVLHCAGPFVRTSPPMVAACLGTGTSYLDITGEMGVFESILHRGEQAKGAGVVLLPGVGFDVVPTDCLAARLAEALPEATELVLAFDAEGGSWSRGTLKTMIEAFPHMGAIRRGGEIRPVPPAFDDRTIPFPHGERRAVTIPWGDVSTAFHSTGIPDIRVYSGMPPAAIRRLRLLRPVMPLLGSKPVKRALQWWVGKTVTGPDAATRESGRMHVWGEVRSPDGRSARGTVSTPEGYRFTAEASVEAARRVAAGEVGAGAWTPSRAFGAGFVEEMDGVEVGEVELGTAET